MVPLPAGGSVGIEFHLLGPFAVFADGVPVETDGATANALLVALLLRPGGYARAEDLIAAVWGQRDATSGDNLYHHISRLRRFLGPFGMTVTRGRGPEVVYRLVPRPGALDAARFEEQVAAAAALEDSEPAAALGRLRAALGLWRGPAAFPELRLPGVRALGHALDGARLRAEERRAELEIRLGEPDTLVERLRWLAAHHPGHPGIVAMLIRMLRATGRGAEAGEIYLDAKRRSGAGLAPTVEQAYRERPAGPGSAVPPVPPAAGWHPPAQMPAPPRYFTGRAAEAARLLRTRDGDAPIPISAVYGMPGVGKTALVLRVAHRLIGAGSYPDGALFIDLRGFSGQEPVDPAAALDALLRGLGVRAEQIPAEVDERAALYRTVLARRRVLVVLDNARDETQVRPLLPGTARSLVPITSRRRLTGLDDADPIDLDVLPLPEAVGLFRTMVGTRDAGSDEVIEEIVRLCGLLPLAVRIAGARLMTSRSLRSERLLEQLRSEQHRLAVLDDGDRSVVAAMAMSFQHLPADQRAAFAVLGLHPGTEFEVYATAALLGIAAVAAQRLLDELERVSLLEAATPERYRFHDLVRAYASEVGASVNLDRSAALRRLYACYGRATARATDRVYPYEAEQRAVAPPSSATAPEFGTAALARSWLDTELANLLAVAHYAADHGEPEHTIHQSGELSHYLRNCGKYHEAYALHQRAYEIATATGDIRGELAALTALGNVHRTQGRNESAMECLRHAIRLARDATDRHGELNALAPLGRLYYVQGAHERAIECLERALALAGEIGREPATIPPLITLGNVRFLQGEYEEAQRCFRRATRLAVSVRDRASELEALIGLAYIDYGQGRADAAEETFQRVMRLGRRFGHVSAELNALSGLASVARQRGEYEPAAAAYRRLLELARVVGDRFAELSALLGLGNIDRSSGRYVSAAGHFEQVRALAADSGQGNPLYEAHLGLGRTYGALGENARAVPELTRAVELAREWGQRPDEVRALDSLAHALVASGQPEQGRRLWGDTLRILAELDLSTTEDVSVADIEASLAGLDGRRWSARGGADGDRAGVQGDDP
jgi:tetratricopeptide (TPR) repeat protein/DNA-binding SARP family transcriptional activator